MKYFSIFKEQIIMLSLMGDEEAGKIVKVACDYFLDYPNKPELDGLSVNQKRVLEQLFENIDRSHELLQAKIKAGQKGADKRWNADKPPLG